MAGTPGRCGAAVPGPARNCFSLSTISGVGGTTGRATGLPTGVGRFGSGGRTWPGSGRLPPSPMPGRRWPSPPVACWPPARAAPGTMMRGGALAVPGNGWGCFGRARRISPGFGPVGSALPVCSALSAGAPSRAAGVTAIRGEGSTACGRSGTGAVPGAGRRVGGGSDGVGVTRVLPSPASGRKVVGRGGSSGLAADGTGRAAGGAGDRLDSAEGCATGFVAETSGTPAGCPGNEGAIWTGS